MNLYLITGLYVVFGGVGIGIFLWGKPDGNSLFDRLYRLVCVHLPRWLKKAVVRVVGKRGEEFLDATWVYLCYTSNPLIQIFYLCVVFGGYIAFVLAGFQHMDTRLIHPYHKYNSLVVICACLAVWWRACSTDPGAVTRENVDDIIEIFPWDEQIFTKAQCKTCDLPKPARSKHCALCDICVARFDHHCIWINNCVGVGNHKWFLGFLFTHLCLCFYGCGVGTTIAYEIVVQKDLFNAVFIEPVTRERYQATYGTVLQYMIATEGMVLFVTVLCGFMGLVLFGFFMWHLNLVRTATTTNELSKWSYVRWCLKQEGEEGKERLKTLVNIYNKGLVHNFREVFFPIDVHRLPKQTEAARLAQAAAANNGLNGSGDGKKGKTKKS